MKGRKLSKPHNLKGLICLRMSFFFIILEESWVVETGRH